MAKKQNTESSENNEGIVEPPKRPKINISKASDFVEKWCGLSPLEMNPELTKEDIPQRTDKDVIGFPIVVHGCLKMKGEFKGKPHDFMLLCCTSVEDESFSSPFTVVTSGMVVLKKFDRIAEKDGFSVLGQIIRPEDKAYYDFVDIE